MRNMTIFVDIFLFYLHTVTHNNSQSCCCHNYEEHTTANFMHCPYEMLRHAIRYFATTDILRYPDFRVYTSVHICLEISGSMSTNQYERIKHVCVCAQKNCVYNITVKQFQPVMKKNCLFSHTHTQCKQVLVSIYCASAEFMCRCYMVDHKCGWVAPHVTHYLLSVLLQSKTRRQAR